MDADAFLAWALAQPKDSPFFARPPRNVEFEELERTVETLGITGAKAFFQQRDAEEADKYVLRFFFDGVTGDCLWAGNDLTRDSFDYPISVADLPVSAEVVDLGQRLGKRFAAVADLDFLWPDSEPYDRFRADAKEFVRLLRESLPDNFIVRDESCLT
jgi:hypothetical protein